jgi:catechol 2,3-dioxygenase-like lactoylglutathione lyase family enzyme
MRTALAFISGIIVGLAVQPGWAQQERIVGLNHVAVSVADYAGALEFYGKRMGFREAFSFRDADGSPYLTYFQINRNTFVEVMQATTGRPAGCPHFGLEVEHLDSTIEQLKGRGVQVRAPSVSPRTGTRIALASGPGGIDMELLEFGPQSLHRKVIESWK